MEPTDPLEDSPPEVSSDALKSQLFLPQLARLLEDPAGFPLADSVDSVRVRLDEAVASIERRCDEVAVDALRRVQMLRLAVGVSAAIGVGAILVALAVPPVSWVAFLVAAGELAAVVVFSKRLRIAAADAFEIGRLRSRYRPALESCRTLEELRALAARIGAEVAATTVDPREGQ